MKPDKKGSGEKAIPESLVEKLGWKGYIEFKSLLKRVEGIRKKELILVLLEVKLLSAQEEVGPLLQLLGYVAH